MPPPAPPDAEPALRAAIIAAARALAPRGLSHGTSGNVSARLGAGLLITPSGVPYDALEPADLAWVALADGRWSGPLAPSSEWRIHRDVLAARPDMGAVVHTHSPRAAALACLGRGIPAIHYMVAAAGGADIRCAPYATFGTQALSDAALAALEGRTACLLAHHGVVALGATLDRALALATEVEWLAGVLLDAEAAGRPTILDEAEMARVVAAFRSYGAQAQAAAREETA